MPGQVRADKKAMKIFWKVMQTPKEVRQDPQKKPSQRLVNAWNKDSAYAQ